MDSFDHDRYERQLVMPGIGIQGQERLNAGKVLIIGAGGLGSPCAFYLAAAGVGTVGIVDDDSVALSNLNRQILHGTDDLGRLKVISARETLQSLNPFIQVNTHNIRLDKDNIMDLIGEYDVIVAAVDNFASRFLINDACFFAGKPLVEGGASGWCGQVTTIFPGKGPCLRCLIDVPFSSTGSIDTRQRGVLGAVPGIIGALQGLETIKILLGSGDVLIGRVLAFDGNKSRFREVRIARKEKCPLCGGTPTILSLADSTEF